MEPSLASRVTDCLSLLNPQGILVPRTHPYRLAVFLAAVSGSKCSMNTHAGAGTDRTVSAKVACSDLGRGDCVARQEQNIPVLL